MTNFLLQLFFFLLGSFCFSQVEVQLKDDETGSTIYGAAISSANGSKRLSDPDGIVKINENELPNWFYVSHSEYVADSIFIDGRKSSIIWTLKSQAQLVKTMVVSANRRKQNLKDVPISMEILSAELIDSKAMVNLEETVNQAPGVYAMDGQVSIRGGSGFAYGVGSRVMVLYNGIPLISPDLGDAKWNAIPLESSEQVEIIKGASSVLYGSGALNGIITVSPRKLRPEGDLKVKLQTGIYDNPKRRSLIWWNRNPIASLTDIYYGKSFNRSGFSFSANGFHTEGYKQGEVETRGRVGGSYYFKPKKNVKFGVNLFSQYEYSGRFLIWENDSLAYIPFGGSDPNTVSSIVNEKSLRMVLDPFMKVIDKKKNIHDIRTRYYLVTIGGTDNVFENSVSEQYYLDYQFTKQWGKSHTLTSGIMNNYNKVRSADIFKDHDALNSAAFTQYELNKNRWNVSAGVRFEYFKQDTMSPDSKFDLWETKAEIPIYPIFRSALNYQLTENTHIRTSFGQGIRFPAVGERFINTSNGGINIFSNPDLKPEKGWSTEVGIKQDIRIGGWRGFADLAGFVNYYENMIEFAFGFYIPEDLTVSLNQENPGYIYNWLGFKATNSEEALISGIEFSMNGSGRIKDVEIITLLGYTYLNPVSLNTNPQYQMSFSDSGSNMLKYRFNHLAKIDIQSKFKGFFIGLSSRYNSFMSNIDAVFEENIAGTELIPGLRKYREENQQGSLVFDVRMGYNWKEKYRTNFIVNNILNEEYTSRPGDVQPPRQFILQLQYGI